MASPQTHDQERILELEVAVNCAACALSVHVCVAYTPSRILCIAEIHDALALTALPRIANAQIQNCQLELFELELE